MNMIEGLFLGTSSMFPTKERSHSCVFLRNETENILFDCGEGTQRQFQKSSLSYMQISKIFLSHFHGDHFLGIPGLIQTMQLNDREEPVYIYGPKGGIDLVQQLLSLGYFRPEFRIIPKEVNDGDVLEFDEYIIRVLRVKHNVPAVAYALEEHQRPGKFNKPQALELGIPEGPLFSKLQHGEPITLKDGRRITPDMVLGISRPGRKIVFSGDTTPYDKLASFSKHADVLIHEATFDSELADIAGEYGHTTAYQAAEIAKEADVETLFLTHISPRYLDHHIIENDARKIFQKSYVPRDLQEVEVKLKK